MCVHADLWPCWTLSPGSVLTALSFHSSLSGISYSLIWPRWETIKGVRMWWVGEGGALGCWVGGWVWQTPHQVSPLCDLDRCGVVVVDSFSVLTSNLQEFQTHTWLTGGNVAGLHLWLIWYSHVCVEVKRWCDMVAHGWCSAQLGTRWRNQMSVCHLIWQEVQTQRAFQTFSFTLTFNISCSAFTNVSAPS